MVPGGEHAPDRDVLGTERAEPVGKAGRRAWLAGSIGVSQGRTRFVGCQQKPTPLLTRKVEKLDPTITVAPDDPAEPPQGRSHRRVAAARGLGNPERGQRALVGQPAVHEELQDDEGVVRTRQTRPRLPFDRRGLAAERHGDRVRDDPERTRPSVGVEHADRQAAGDLRAQGPLQEAPLFRDPLLRHPRGAQAQELDSLRVLIRCRHESQKLSPQSTDRIDAGDGSDLRTPIHRFAGTIACQNKTCNFNIDLLVLH